MSYNDRPVLSDIWIRYRLPIFIKYITQEGDIIILNTPTYELTKTIKEFSIRQIIKLCSYHFKNRLHKCLVCQHWELWVIKFRVGEGITTAEQ